MDSQNKLSELVDTNMEKLQKYVELCESLTIDASYEYERKKIIELIAENLTQNKDNILAHIIENFKNVIKSNDINKYKQFTYDHEILCSDELKKIKLNTLRDTYIILDDKMKRLLNNKLSLDELYKIFGTDRFNILIKFVEYAPKSYIEKYKIKIDVVFKATGFVDFINLCNKNGDNGNIYYDNNDTTKLLENIKNTSVIATNTNMMKKTNNVKEYAKEYVKEYVKLPDDANFQTIDKIGEMILNSGIDEKIKQKYVVQYLINTHREKFIERIKNKKGYYDSDEDEYYDSNDNVLDDVNDNVQNKTVDNILHSPTLQTINISSLFDSFDFIEKNEQYIKKVNNYTNDTYYSFTSLENNHLNTMLNFGPCSVIRYIIYLNYYTNNMMLLCKIYMSDNYLSDPNNYVFRNILAENDHEKKFGNIVRSYAKELALGLPTTLSNFFDAFRSLQINRKKCIEHNQYVSAVHDIPSLEYNISSLEHNISSLEQNIPLIEQIKPLTNSSFVSLHFNQKFSDYISSKTPQYKYENEIIMETILEELITDDLITPEMNNEINNILNVRDFTFKYGCCDYVGFGKSLFSTLTLEFTAPQYLLITK